MLFPALYILPLSLSRCLLMDLYSSRTIIECDSCSLSAKEGQMENKKIGFHVCTFDVCTHRGSYAKGRSYWKASHTLTMRRWKKEEAEDLYKILALSSSSEGSKLSEGEVYKYERSFGFSIRNRMVLELLLHDCTHLRRLFAHLHLFVNYRCPLAWLPL